MSHFTTIETQYTDAAAIKLALQDLHFEVTSHEKNILTLKDYSGGDDPQKVCIRARRTPQSKQLAGKSELGFFTVPGKSTFQIRADHMDTDPVSVFDKKTNKYEKQTPVWLKHLKQRYSYHKTMAEIKAKGYTVSNETTDARGQIHVSVRKF